jgi:hypothetical protein
MDKDYLILKRASASRCSGEWSDDDYDVLADSEVVGRIFKVNAAPNASSPRNGGRLHTTMGGEYEPMPALTDRRNSLAT